MHRQFYDNEEEPRITPKPISKFDHFAVPTVPEVSLIFDKPDKTEARNNESSSLSSARLTKPARSLYCDGTVKTSTLPVWNEHDSYAYWKQENYRHRAGTTTTNTTHDLSSRKNVYNHSYNHAPYSHEQQHDDNTMKQQQKKLINRRINDGTLEKSVKFQCSNIGVDDSYNLDERSSTLSSLPRSKGQMSCTSLQRATRGITDAGCISGNVMPDATRVKVKLKQSEHLQMPYSGYHPEFCLPGYSNYGVDNNETVKSLLQLVNSQSEQIRNLQLQIDRLVRMQEESFRNKSACVCHSSASVVNANQVFRYPSMNYYDATVGSSSSCLAQCPSQGQSKSIKENHGQSTESESVVEKKNLAIVDESNKLEKKAFMEQKVSIGVMTSFEFTVQNSPFVMESSEESEVRSERKEAPRETTNANVNTIQCNDTSESAKRCYKNTFARKPSAIGAAQLENIVEDSESHLSSSQQQSSNFNASSVRDSERHTPRQPDLYNAARVCLESSNSVYQRPTLSKCTELNHAEKPHEEIGEKYTGKSGNTDDRLENVRKIADCESACVNVCEADYNCIRHANYSKAPVVGDSVPIHGDYIPYMYSYTAIDGEESNGKVLTVPTTDKFNVDSPATHCYALQGHKNPELPRCAKETKDVGDSVILSGGDFRVLERPPPTPEPSIHVEMQEYTSDDESDKLKRTSKIGWTFYNNVLGQVNEILQNSSMINNKDENDACKVARKVEQENDTETKTALDTVKAATLEQLRRLGISLTEKNEHGESNGNNKTLEAFDSSFYPRLDRQTNMIQTRSIVNETNTSMHMKALALKYLSDEQLADIALHKQESSSLKHLLLSNMEGTNMSFATMRYLERYQLLPGKNNVQVEGTDRMHGEVAPKADLAPVIGKNSPALRRFPFVQTPGSNCPNRILDLSTLKRQPKLL